MQNKNSAYQFARECYAAKGVDTEKAIRTLAKIRISMHCWQGDDVAGFEHAGSLTGGIQTTGNYPGKARNPEELRKDLEFAYSLIPGKHRLNIHANYAERGNSKADRNEYTTDMFRNWIDWAKANDLKLDFNPTYFSHPLSANGTLSAADAGVRKFWIEHGKACRHIAAAMGEELKSPAVINFWIPDGSKDTPVDKMAPRARLVESLDEIFAERLPARFIKDALESKLFGIGAESYTVGSNEFYMSYAVSRKKMICFDAGHFHPTESIADKISAVMPFMPEVLLHVSRGVRWDSDHVIVLDEELRSIAQEIVRHDLLKRVNIALDYFDASINRIAAWVIGMRNMQKALLLALLEPIARMKELENSGDWAGRLARLEENRFLPAGVVWEEFCSRMGVAADDGYMDSIRDYEKKVLACR